MPKWVLLLRRSCSFCSGSFWVSSNTFPSKTIVPVSGDSKKFRQRRRVVFPLPEGPIIESTCPRSNVNDRFSSTFVPENSLEIPVTSKNGIRNLLLFIENIGACVPNKKIVKSKSQQITENILP